ncbi:peptidase inhibitor family I36 protein [Micromonospora sp. NBC_01796]|uniref:peptidase inhibitor family I36 protein n=1 Tax=Micromonospora sp. NBC_01796 TaxID=2975987 RepID=UPI002DD899B2|nr:peptidase inhibitor family I36 protein [Micromonospora sp. NBC_01796]WSA84008.1 peptidase inhibitor family I36 protein [Micromonospora sp. NBC_01796]
MTPIPNRTRRPIAARLLVVLITGLFAITAGASAASAAPQAGMSSAEVKLQSDISAHIKAYGGTQISTNEIAWRGGRVVLTIPQPGSRAALAPGEKIAPLGTANCARGWTCLYEHSNFDGRRLTFTDCISEYLPNYGFRDQASSWHNNQTGGAVSVVYNYVGSSPQWIWSEPSPRQSTYVGDANNDKADAIQVC